MRQPRLGPVLQIFTPDPASLDPVLRARVEEAARAAHAQGHAEGVATGRQDALADAEALAARVREAATEASQRLLRARQERAAEVTDLAFAIAEAVLGRQPDDGGVALLDRVRTVLEQIDDDPVTVVVAPDDVEYVSSGIAGVHGVTVQADDALSAGQGRVVGPWARADLTVDSALVMLREVLDG